MYRHRPYIFKVSFIGLTKWKEMHTLLDNKYQEREKTMKWETQ